jgi:hypothetical protein
MSESLPKTQDTRVRTVSDGATVVAHILDLNPDGPVVFPTSETAEMQLGLGTVANKKVVPAHIHNQLPRSTFNTSEFILVLKGIMDVVFLNQQGQRVEAATLTDGMGFLQLVGGHRITFHPGTRYIELKQGPYFGNKKDKTLLLDA